jgi:hypothetical protein
MGKITIRNQLRKQQADAFQDIGAILSSEKVKTLAAGALIVVGTLGLFGLTLVAPKTLQAFAPLMYRKSSRPLRRSEQRTKLVRSFYYLKESGKIIIEEKGIKQFNKITNSVSGIPRPRKWGKTWWVIAADIPTREYSVAGDMLRRKLNALQCYHWQRTLWAHPFDCRRELEHIANSYGIGKFVTIMEVARLDAQDRQRFMKFFKARRIL